MTIDRVDRQKNIPKPIKQQGNNFVFSLNPMIIYFASWGIIKRDCPDISPTLLVTDVTQLAEGVANATVI